MVLLAPESKQSAGFVRLSQVIEGDFVVLRYERAKSSLILVKLVTLELEVEDCSNLRLVFCDK